MVFPSNLIRNLKRLALKAQKKEEVILFEGKSKYRSLTVVENTKQHTRTMYTGNRLFVAGVDTTTGFPLFSPYFLADLVVPQPKTVLFLGGGPCVVPSYVWNHYKPKLIHVVDHDPLTTRLAKKYFNLPNSKKFKVFHQDAKYFLDNTDFEYNIIYFDIGLTRKRGLNKKDLYGLCNLEGIRLLNKHLHNRGELIYVVISRLTGLDLKFLKQLSKGLNKTFPSCYVFSDVQSRPSKLQSVIFLATKHKSNISKNYEQIINSPNPPHDKSVYTELMAKQIVKPGAI